MSKKLADHINVLHYSIYTEYRKYDKISKKNRIKGRENLRGLLKKVCDKIGQEIVERKAGVHIKRLGYFFIWKIPRKTTYFKNVRGGTREEKYNYHTDHYMYSPVFLQSLDSTDSLKYWSMDNAFCEKVKVGVRKKVSSGYKYKIYPYSITRLNRI